MSIMISDSISPWSEDSQPTQAKSKYRPDTCVPIFKLTEETFKREATKALKSKF